MISNNVPLTQKLKNELANAALEQFATHQVGDALIGRIIEMLERANEAIILDGRCIRYLDSAKQQQRQDFFKIVDDFFFVECKKRNIAVWIQE